MVTAYREADIAIIGMSCRFPGADSVDAFWRNLCDGVESVTFFSDEELLAAGVPPSLIGNPNYVKAAPLLREPDMFDADFFGLSPKEAALMDPQHRLYLEVAWETFENAGYNPYSYPGKVGVVSSCGGVVSSYLIANSGHDEFPGQTASAAHISNDKDFLSTRVSFKLNLRGPSFTVQSACSSSLLAVHQACQLLRLHECDMAVAGAASVRVPQVQGYIAEKRNLYSLDGHCRPFDADGQGTIFGSGVGAVLLKPLAAAVAARDRIIAVIKGTAANNDGSGKISYTAPSVGQQSQAVADAIKAAGTRADRIGYVECHSTGTIVGDPLEIEALSNAFHDEAGRKQYCAIGSLKANIGHPEQAAGIAGVIKTALILQHRQIPPSINFVKPNPRIDFAASPFYVNDRIRDFPESDGPRQAGLNSLGIGGTNAFAVLEEAPAAAESAALPLIPVAVLSAKTPAALIARVRQLADRLDDDLGFAIEDICYTTCLSRGQFAFRFAACAGTTSGLKQELRRWLETADAAKLKRAGKPRIAFMFSGQGPQHAGMAAELYRTRAVFREAMDECARLARPHLEQDLLEVIFAQDGGEAAIVNRTDYTQPALFAVEYALVALLKSWGITPSALIGHSLGEIAAACTAGVLSLPDAMRLAIARGALMHKVPAGGAMAAVWAPESSLRDLIATVAPGVSVAAMNGPSNTVLTGDRDELGRLLQELGRRNINTRELRISNGFHSPRTDPILDELEQIAGTLAYARPCLPLISNLTGAAMESAPDAAYWRRHTREPVRFGDGMAAAAAFDCGVFLEIGPHPVLLPLAQACLSEKGRPGVLAGTLNRQKSDGDAMAEMLAALYRAGADIDWAAVHAESAGRRVALPTYPFERKRYWLEAPRRALPMPAEREHPLVGVRVSGEGGEAAYEKRYSLRELGFVADHRVFGQVFLPTTVELEAIMAIGRRHLGAEVTIEQVMHHQAVTIEADQDRVVRITVAPMKSDRFTVKLASLPVASSAPWHDHMTCILRRETEARGDSIDLQEIVRRCPTVLPRADVYDRLHRLGLEYGPCFQGIEELHVGEGEVLARVRLPQADGMGGYAVHPAFLDACLHAYPFVIADADAGLRSRACWLPIALEGFSCRAAGIREAWVHTRLRPDGDGLTQTVDVRICGDAGQSLAELRGLKVRLLQLGKHAGAAHGEGDVFYSIRWRKAPRAGAIAAAEPGAWILFADKTGIAAALVQRLRARGASCHLVRGGEAFHQSDLRTWAIDPHQAEDHRAVLRQIEADERLPVRGVVDLRGLDAPAVEDLTIESLARGSETICRGALALVHALTAARAPSPAAPRLWFVTRETQDAHGTASRFSPVQACLWGLGRTAALEYPNIWGGLIDLRPEGDIAPVVDALAAELIDPDGESQIAIAADGARSAARFTRQPLTDLPERPLRIRADGTYLIAGGLGMIGVSTARWLIGQGARHIVLAGRNATPDRVEAFFTEKDRGSAALHAISADISRADEVRRLFDTIRAELPPLRGVVHSAGVLDDGVLARQSWSRFSPLFAPRVYGSWLLHEQTAAMDLDFFVLNSSLLSLLGSAGQANYTASAAFLDCLAAYRRGAGLPAVAVNWCAWSEGGLATVSGARGQEMWSRLGMKSLAPGPAMELFDRLMQRDVTGIALAVADWPVYAGRIGNPPFMSELAGRNKEAAPAKPAARGADLARVMTPQDDSIVLPSAALRTPIATAGEDKRAEIVNLLQRHVMAELGFQEPIDPDRPLNEVGLDSLRSVSLANRLEDEIGIPISVTELIAGPSILELADHVGDLLETSRASGLLDADSTPAAAPSARREAARSPVAPVWGAPADTLGSGRADDKRAGAGDDAAERAAPLAAPFVARPEAKWLISPRPTPRARARLFCFPYAGGGLVTFRSWPQLLGDAVEVVAVEAPGRGTRIGEAPVEDMDSFVGRLLPELISWIDRPAAFFGHCLGGLTMFATACALPQRNRQLLTHLFACGARPPHLLRAMGEFEDNLVYDMMLHPRFDPRRPAYAQDDEIFAGIIRQFDTSAADEMLAVRKLRDALMPTIRAEFGMASNYIYRPGERFSCPITSFVGDKDPWVSEQHSQAWGELTSARFESQLRHGSHFLIAEDRAHIVQTIGAQFAAPVIAGAGL